MTATPRSPTGSTAVRVALASAGLAGVAYGLALLVGLPRGQVWSVLLWAAGGVVGHDGVLAPIVVVLGVVVAVRAPDRWRVPLVRLLVVLGPLTLAAVPVLGRFGAKADNPSLLDRPYWLGYAAVVALLLVVTVVDATRRRRRGPDGVSRRPR